MKQPLNPDTYRAVFVHNPHGPEVLEELSTRFYDIASYTRGDPYETAFKEGQRFVLRSILAKLAQIPEEEHDLQA